jgi:hypothetical protein
VLRHACGLTVSGGYAYVTASYSNRLTIIDIANPFNPRIVASIQDVNRLDTPVDVSVSGGYAYVVDQGNGLGRLAVVDVHDPNSPQIVGLLDQSNTVLNGAYRVHSRNGFAYVSAVSADSVSVIDVSNPAAPRAVGTVSTGAYLHRTTGLDIGQSGRYLVAVSPYQSSVSQPLYPPFPLQSGGLVISGHTSVIDLAPVTNAIAISATSKPANPTTQTTANFSFGSTNPVTIVRCQIDAGALSPCTTPSSQNYVALPAGTHTFTVQSTDSAGDTATDSYTWTISANGGPRNTLPPSIGGSAVQGQTLNASQGTWVGNPQPTLTNEWDRCDTSGTNCVVISGQTGLTYTLVQPDVGWTIRFKVTAMNASGTVGASSAATAVVAALGGIGPTTPVLDTFNRANGGAGANWTPLRPTGYASMNVSANAAIDSSASVFAANYWNQALFGPDVEAYATVALVGGGDSIRIGARVQNAGTTSASGYYVQITSTGTWTILRVDAGPSTTLATGPTQPLLNGDRIMIRIVGSVISALRFTGGTWAVVMSYDTARDATRYTSTGRTVIQFKTSTIDSFGGGTI